MSGTKDDGAISRRSFLQGLGAAAVACPLLAACEFVEVYGDDPELEETTFDVNQEGLEALQEVGGTACLEAGTALLLLIRKSEEEILAVDRICPHQGLNMGPCGNNPGVAQWNNERQELTCIWHQSVFNTDGEVVSGPSPRPLRVYATEFDPATGLGRVFGAGDS